MAQSAIFPFGKVLLGCEEIVATRARLLDMAQEAEGYRQPHLMPVIWDFEGATAMPWIPPDLPDSLCCAMPK
ncbi:hypothetical protein OK006_10328 [Actinobacteria bacterium OK006]|nr:hypothetical protein OK006_10328 [Actinobacteria bacterium OK006]